MSGVPIDQLDAATRKRLGLPSGRSTRGSRARSETTGPGLPVVCHACMEPCDGEAAQKRHMDETGHLLFQCLTA